MLCMEVNKTVSKSSAAIWTRNSANIDGGQPWRRGYGENIIFTDWERDNYFRAAKQEVSNEGRVGVEYDHINLENLKKLQDALPAAEFVDITETSLNGNVSLHSSNTFYLQFW